MPRPKKPGAPEPKRRSRNGCWPCKTRKIKCGEEHPSCLNCQRAGEACDYSIRLNWDGRRSKRPESGTIDFSSDVPSPTVPAKGFKLVHQFPLSGSTTGRRLEPLDGAASSSKPVTGSPGTSNQSVNSPPDPFQVPSKRVKLDVTAEPSEASDRRSYSSPSASTVDGGTPAFRLAVSNTPSSGSPLTPAASSTYSDDASRQGSRPELPPISSPETRRMSVHSLLSGPPGPGRLHDDFATFQRPPATLTGTQLSPNGPKYYGIDRGLPDLDLGRNDDNHAISHGSGSSQLTQNDQSIPSFGGYEGDLFASEFAFGVEASDTSEKIGGYYDKPVEIYISQKFEPLPPKLLQNPMNLLYFHHFINHTAKVLVPYDDPEANPFRTTLPLMAVRNENLLALVLAYSASHRARFLKQPEPQLRIATWVDDIFPALRGALSDPNQSFSDANVATTIMLASLETVSPKIFGYAIPWQKHLSLARALITARPGGLHYQSNFRQSHVCSFLFSWAAYLDVMGSLTGGPKDTSTAWIFDYEMEDKNDGYDEIDCLMGFTTRCSYLLAKLADLARKCDGDRIAPNGKIRDDWKPNQETLAKALKLESDVKDSMSRDIVPCKHIRDSVRSGKWDKAELAAINEAFHWAGLIHIYRRILGRESEDGGVQACVRHIISCFSRIRRGSSAEYCALFPIFTAGCDANDEAQRAFVLDRLGGGESNIGSAVFKVYKARRLVEKVWETGQPWETLLSTEFIG
ncbi:fungal-specific transcription factor domain-containing protein [Xylariales sp. PMI_506]|nr:fungal-specific transcription factor domain-containing protein [Xylariales sp. PMI_506]